MLTGDGAGGEHGSGEHQFPVNRNGLPLEWSDIQTHRIVDERELTLGAQHRGDLWDIGGALVQTGYMGDMWDAELGQLRRPGLAVIDHVMRSEEHTSELQSLMRISYAVFCLKKKKKNTYTHNILKQTP